jgi:HEAT repeat protein
VTEDRLSGPAPEGKGGAAADAPAADEREAQVLAGVRDWVTLLVKTVRASQLYVSTNPILRGFLDDLGRKMDVLWDDLRELTFGIEEYAWRWRGHVVYQADPSPDNLAFQFFKDGIRRLTFLPGAELEELREFVDVIREARQAGEQGDDLLTLLWYRDFGYIRYEYVDALSSDVEVPGPNLEGLQATAGAVLPEIPGLELASEVAGPQVAMREDFQPTLYFLDESDVAYLQRELRLEWERDIRRDVLTALLDQVEIGMPENRKEALESLRDMLPRLLSAGDFANAALVLSELQAIARAQPEVAPAIERLLEEASEPRVLEELVRTLEDGSVNPSTEAFSTFLGALRPNAIPTLIRVIPGIARAEARVQLVDALERLAAAHHDRLVRLFASPDAGVVAEAARMVGRLGVTEAAPQLAALLERPEDEVRAAAVEALATLRSSIAGETLLRALDDPSREVRVAAARGLAQLAYAPGAERLERWVKGKALRSRDLTEQLAYFEAYAAAAGPAAVPVLDRLLNKRTWWGGRRPAPIRACAARALGLLRDPAAAAALARAERDGDPMVRSAVLAARRGAREATT